LNLALAPIGDLAPLLARRELSPVELTNAVLDQIERLDGRLNCYINVLRAGALEQARVAEAEIGHGDYRGPLHGIPVAIKDNLEMAGVPTTGASKVFADYVPAEDAPAIARVKGAGAVVVGKTHLHELGMGATSVNPHYGPSRNPWNLDRITGGSSGGSAAAVAAGLCVAALGTDAGGSVRIPAALCGVVGLKPTHGRVPIRGCLGASNPTVDHIGPMTRTVSDAALLLRVLAGSDSRDPTTAHVPPLVDDFGLSRPIADLRVGVPVDHYFDHLDSEVESAVRAAIAWLADLGATLVDVSLPDHAILLDAMSGMAGDRVVYYQPWLRSRLADFGYDVQASLLAAQFIPAADHALALRARRAFAELYHAAFQGIDLLATPTVVSPAYPIDEADQPTDPTPPKDKINLVQNTLPSNRTGRPAISLPAGFTSDGLPIGLQLIGRPFDEATLLRAAAAYEAATDWHRRTPPIAE
jgi:aspartyl-tRNA(Asn)/glutamyl-tRNA(Gln) amidotransferase subunit A